MRDLSSGRVALVTGASGGIGRAVAVELGARGATVVVHGRNEERTNAAAEAVREAGAVAHVVTGQLDSDASAEAVVEDALSAAGHIDILVNNAGGFEVCTWEQGDAARWLETYQVNVGSMVRTVRALTPGMRERGWGRVVNVSSVSAKLAPPFFPDYAAAKAATLNMTVSLAKHLAGSGVTVNTVSPGPVVTETWEAFALQVAGLMGWEPELESVKGKLLGGLLANPSGRLGTPEDVAHAVAFLVGENSGYVNGVNLRVDGGLTATP